MPTLVLLDPARRRLTIGVYGVICLADLLSGFDNQMTHHAWMLDTIIDTSPAERVDLSTGDMVRLAQYMAAHAALHPDIGPITIVAPGDTAFGMARMFQGYVDGLIPARVSVVRRESAP